LAKLEAKIVASFFRTRCIFLPNEIEYKTQAEQGVRS